MSNGQTTPANSYQHDFWELKLESVNLHIKNISYLFTSSAYAMMLSSLHILLRKLLFIYMYNERKFKLFPISLAITTKKPQCTSNLVVSVFFYKVAIAVCVQYCVQCAQ